MAQLIRQWTQISALYQRGTLLLGNGSSIAVSPSFAYGSLRQHVQANGLLTDDIIRLFHFFDTSDFELILRLVWQAANVNTSLGIQDERTHQAYVRVRNCLIQAVRNVHPEYGQVRHHLPQMYSFLKSFDTVLSLNYDLLVYWAMADGFTARDGHAFMDCFSLGGRFNDNWRRYRNAYPNAEYSRTLVFYPHGSLALCRDRFDHEFKIRAGAAGLLEAILTEWEGEQIVPLFVSEGIATQKVASIQSSHYLSTVYREVLTSGRRTLTLFGWGIGEHDRHLLRQMRDTGIERVAISVKDRDEAYCNHAYQAIQDELGFRWRENPIPVDFFDCESPGCWIHPPQWRI